MWVWHVPALYDLALEQPVVHVLEHLVSASAGLLDWWRLLSPVRTRYFRGLQPVVSMAVTKVLVGLPGIGLTSAPNALYPFFEEQPHIWGFSALDQAVAGAIEQSLVLAIAIAFLFVRALGESEQDEQRAERYGAV